ncbi:MAG: hypothetical protein WC223_07985 [Bacteroidales bacterium]|jgi:hypothetical protein
MESARSIGIVYEATNQLNYDIVNDFLKFLKEKQKSVKVIGYIPERKLFQDYYLKLGFDFFSYSDVNWYLKPTKLSVIDFIDTDFDVFIDLSTKQHFPLDYIAAASKAKFKIGRFVEGTKTPYDMMIHTDKIKSLEEYIETIKLYFTTINKIA